MGLLDFLTTSVRHPALGLAREVGPRVAGGALGLVAASGNSRRVGQQMALLVKSELYGALIQKTFLGALELTAYGGIAQRVAPILRIIPSSFFFGICSSVVNVTLRCVSRLTGFECSRVLVEPTATSGVLPVTK